MNWRSQLSWRRDYTPGVDGPQPFFNAPALLMWFVAAFVAMHAIVVFSPPQLQEVFFAYGALIPARYGFLWELPIPPELAALNNHPVLLTTPFFTHMFLHGNLAHLGFNSIWFLIFGTPIARRLAADGSRPGIHGVLGASIFKSFFFLGGAFAGGAYMLLHPGEFSVLVGASGGISALMGGAARFIFIRQPIYGEAPHRIAPLGDTSVIGMTLAWTLINAAFGLAHVFPFAEGMQVAWEAHLAGFYFGLIAYPLFDLSARPLLGHSSPSAL